MLNNFKIYIKNLLTKSISYKLIYKLFSHVLIILLIGLQNFEIIHQKPKACPAIISYLFKREKKNVSIRNQPIIIRKVR